MRQWEAGLAAGPPWPLALSVPSSCITQGECGAAAAWGSPQEGPRATAPSPPAVTWVETGQLEPWSWDLPESFGDTSVQRTEV